MRQPTSHCLIVLIAAVVLVGSLLSPTAQAATVNAWQASGGNNSGNWNDATHWNQGHVPGSPGNTAENVDVNFIGGSAYTVTVTDVMFPTGLTNRAVRIETFVQNIDVNASGASSVTPLNWIVDPTQGSGAVFNGDIFRIAPVFRHANVTFTNVNLTITGVTSASDNSLHIDSTYDVAPLITFNSNIKINAPTGGSPNNDANSTGVGLYLGGQDVNGAIMQMTGGSLIVTNSATSGYVRIGDQGSGPANGRGAAQLILSNTTFTANNIWMERQGILDFNGAGAAANSQVTGKLSVRSGSTVNLNSGNISFGTVQFGQAIIANTTQSVNVAGANVTINTLDPFAGSHNFASSKVLFHVSAGTATINNATVGYDITNRATHELRVSSTGTLNVTNNLILGNTFIGRAGSGLLNMTGGRLNAKNVSVAGYDGSDVLGAGYYNQSGGTSTISGTLRLVTRTNHPANATLTRMGTEEFVVGQGARMVFTGAGMAKQGTTSWMLGDTSGDLNFAGAFEFNPVSGITAQSFLAFSADQGSNVNASSMVEANYGVGTLDLAGLDGSEMLTILPSGLNGTDALYIYSLLGQNAITVTNHLDSTQNLYYFVGGSDPGLNAQTFDLASGGQLIPLSIPEPSAALFLSMGGLLLLRRRSQ